MKCLRFIKIAKSINNICTVMGEKSKYPLKNLQENTPVKVPGTKRFEITAKYIHDTFA